MKRILVLICGIVLSLGMYAQQSQHVKIQGPMGNLDTEVMQPQTQTGHVVILMHGFTGKKESPLFDEIAKDLLAKNYTVVRFDFNGHGQSDGDFQKMTVVNEIEDAKCVISYVESQSYTKDIEILGHSQGGVVASMVAGELGTQHIKKVVLMAPAAVLREDALRGTIFNKSYDPRNYGDGVELFGGKKLGADYIRTAQTLPIYETAGKYTGPVLMIHGTWDVVVPYTFSERYKQTYQNSELQLIEGNDHGFSKDIPDAAKRAVDFLTK